VSATYDYYCAFNTPSESSLSSGWCPMVTQHGMIDKLRGVVEADEAYLARKRKGVPVCLWPESKKRPVVSLMERHHDATWT
jgi:hypothetical protein